MLTTHLAKFIEAFDWPKDEVPGSDRMNGSTIDQLSTVKTLRQLRAAMEKEGIDISGPGKFLDAGACAVVAKLPGIDDAVVRIDFLPAIPHPFLLKTAYKKAYPQKISDGSPYLVSIVKYAPDMPHPDTGGTMTMEDYRRTLRGLKAGAIGDVTCERLLFDPKPSAFVFLNDVNGKTIRYPEGDSELANYPIGFIRDLNALLLEYACFPQEVYSHLAKLIGLSPDHGSFAAGLSPAPDHCLEWCDAQQDKVIEQLQEKLIAHGIKIDKPHPPSVQENSLIADINRSRGIT